MRRRPPVADSGRVHTATGPATFLSGRKPKCRMTRRTVDEDLVELLQRPNLCPASRGLEAQSIELLMRPERRTKRFPRTSCPLAGACRQAAARSRRSPAVRASVRMPALSTAPAPRQCRRSRASRSRTPPARYREARQGPCNPAGFPRPRSLQQRSVPVRCRLGQSQINQPQS